MPGCTTRSAVSTAGASSPHLLAGTDRSVAARAKPDAQHKPTLPHVRARILQKPIPVPTRYREKSKKTVDNQIYPLTFGRYGRILVAWSETKQKTACSRLYRACWHWPKSPTNTPRKPAPTGSAAQPNGIPDGHKPTGMLPDSLAHPQN